MKKCKHCNLTKENSNFMIDPRMKGGYSNLCKDCRNLRRRNRYQSDLEYRINELKRSKKYNHKALLRALNNVSELKDVYIISLLKRDTDLTSDDIKKYPELIKTKKQEVIIKRFIKNYNGEHKRSA